MQSKYAEILDISPPAAVTATQNGKWVDVEGYSEIVALLNLTAVSGTSPTLDIKFQIADDDPDKPTTQWYDFNPAKAFAQKNAVSKDAIPLTGFGKYIRAVFTVGGTTPSFTGTLKLVAKN